MASSRTYTQQIYDYFFVPKPTINFKLIIGGIVLFIIGILIGGSAAIIFILAGLGLAGVPILLYSNKKKKYDARPTDQQMDQWITEDIKDILEKDSLDKLGLDKSQLEGAESLFIPGPVYWSVNGIDGNDIVRRLSNDGTHYKYSCYNIQVFHFTKNYLANYGCFYNWLKNTSVNESTNEFFYKDVVSVKTLTTSSAYTLRDGARLENSQSFQLKLSGDEVTVVTNAANLKTSSVMDSKVDKAVQAIRTLLREKKT
jgi:hypothetical protein